MDAKDVRQNLTELFKIFAAETESAWKDRDRQHRFYIFLLFAAVAALGAFVSMSTSTALYKMTPVAALVCGVFLLLVSGIWVCSMAISSAGSTVRFRRLKQLDSLMLFPFYGHEEEIYGSWSCFGLDTNTQHELNCIERAVCSWFPVFKWHPYSSVESFNYLIAIFFFMLGLFLVIAALLNFTETWEWANALTPKS